MKYIKQADGSYLEIDESSELFDQLSALPKAERPVFLAAGSKEIKAFFARIEERKNP
jgi:hypothetical protein